jgi:hypothetical protein
MVSSYNSSYMKSSFDYLFQYDLKHASWCDFRGVTSAEPFTDAPRTSNMLI